MRLLGFLLLLVFAHKETWAQGSQGFQPAVVQTQQAAPVQTAAPVAAPTPYFLPPPNISSRGGKNNAVKAMEEFLKALGQAPAGAGVPPKYDQYGRPNPAYSDYIGGRPYANEFGPPIINNYEPLKNWNLSRNGINGSNCDQKSNNPLVCMVCNLCFEAGNQNDEGQVAVGRSVMTRAFSRSYGSPKLCDVIYAPKQYSWTHENKDHQLPGSRCKNLAQLTANAEKAIKQGPFSPQNDPPEVQYTNYFAHDLVFPDWAKGGTCAATLRRIGSHTFCNINGTTTRTVADVAQANGFSAGEINTPASPKTNR